MYFPEGTIYPTGEIVAIDPYDCSGSTDPGARQTCAEVVVTVEDGT